VDPDLGFGEGLAVVMATVRSLQPSKGVAIDLPFLPVEFTLYQKSIGGISINYAAG
jgi:hypothetical protein